MIYCWILRHLYIGGGWEGSGLGGRAGWGAEGELYHTLQLEQKSSHYMLIEEH